MIIWGNVMFCPECDEDLSEFEDVDNEYSAIYCPGCDSKLYIYLIDERDEDGDDTTIWIAEIV